MRTTVAVLVLLTVAVTGFGFSDARNIGMRTDLLVVRVSSFGGVTWGRVDVYYDSKGSRTRFDTCARRRCYMHPRHGALLLLRVIPRDSRLWSFRAWIVRNGGQTLHIHSRIVRLRVLGHLHNNVQWFRARVKTNFELAADASSS